MDLHAFNSLHHLHNSNQRNDSSSKGKGDALEAINAAAKGHSERLKAYTAFNAEHIPSAKASRRGDYIQPVDEAFEHLLTPAERVEWKEYNDNLKTAAWEARHGRGPALEERPGLQVGPSLEADPLKTLMAGLCKSKDFSKKLADLEPKVQGGGDLDDDSEWSPPSGGILQEIRARAHANGPSKHGRRALVSTDSGINICSSRDPSPGRINLLVVEQPPGSVKSPSKQRPAKQSLLDSVSTSYEAPGDSPNRRGVQFHGAVMDSGAEDLTMHIVDKEPVASVCDDVQRRLSMTGTLGQSAKFGRRSQGALSGSPSISRGSLAGGTDAPPSPTAHIRLERPAHRASHTGVMQLEGQGPGWPAAADPVAQLSGMMQNARNEFQRLVRCGESMMHERHKHSPLSQASAAPPRGSLSGNALGLADASQARTSLSVGHPTVSEAPARRGSMSGLPASKSSPLVLPALRGSISGASNDAHVSGRRGSYSGIPSPLDRVQMSTRAPRGSLTGQSTSLSKSSHQLTSTRHAEYH